MCHPGLCFNQKKSCSGTDHFSQVVWGKTVKLGMAKATRMQNGLRCTYVVAKYFPGGNEHINYNDNVKEGSFKETEVCHDVFNVLQKFEKRNEAKAKMQDKERQIAKMELLKTLKVCCLFSKYS